MHLHIHTHTKVYKRTGAFHACMEIIKIKWPITNDCCKEEAEEVAVCVLTCIDMVGHLWSHVTVIRATHRAYPLPRHAHLMISTPLVNLGLPYPLHTHTHTHAQNLAMQGRKC